MSLSKYVIPERSFWYIVICGGIIAIICLIGIIPVYRHNANANKDIEKTKEQIKQQVELKPQYSMLSAVLEKKRELALPNPQRTPIPRDQASKFQQDFRTLAGKAGLTVVSVTPDMANLTGESQFLLYNAVVKGELKKMRSMFIELGDISYLSRIDEIDIHQQRDGLECKMKIWIELAK